MVFFSILYLLRKSTHFSENYFLIKVMKTLILTLTSADISWKVLKNYSNKNDTKHDFNYERTLVEVEKIALIYFIEHLWNED